MIVNGLLCTEDYFDLFLHNSTLDSLNLDLSLDLILGNMKILWTTIGITVSFGTCNLVYILYSTGNTIFIVSI